jgi:hypothetical protein
MGQITKRIEAGNYDDELLHVTKETRKAQSAQREVPRQMLERVARAPSPQQRETLNRLVGEKVVTG